MSYRSMPEWADVVPIPLEEGIVPIASIKYTKRFTEVHDYLRAIMAADELSPRALALTADAIAENQANYSAWRHRWRCVEALEATAGYQLSEELAFTERLAEGNSKNYQLWNHRRLLALKLGPTGAPRELQFTDAVLADDEKNYHAWAHRLAIVRAFAELAEAELAYTAAMLARDSNNNSAWNHRYSCLQLGAAGGVAAARAREAQFAASHIANGPDNEAAWSYLRGLYCPPAGAWPSEASAAAAGGGGGDGTGIGTGLDTGLGAGDLRGEPQEIALAALRVDPACRFALALLAEAREREAAGAAAGVAAGVGQVGGQSASAQDARAEAAALYAALGVVDPLRRSYWALRAAALSLVGA